MRQVLLRCVNGQHLTEPPAVFLKTSFQESPILPESSRQQESSCLPVRLCSATLANERRLDNDEQKLLLYSAVLANEQCPRQ